jgi:hypothetical protein
MKEFAKMRMLFLTLLLVCFAACEGAAPQSEVKSPKTPTKRSPDAKESEVAELVTSDRLLALARLAKTRGEQSITTRAVLEADTKTTLDRLLRSVSVLLATHINSGHPAILRNAILTPHEFRVDRWLSHKPGSPESCAAVSVPIRASQGEVVAATDAGTVTVDGIKITEESEAVITFDPRQQYLLFVVECSENRIGLSHNANSVFVVQSDGKVSPVPYNEAIAPFVSEVAKLGTLTALETKLRSLTSK